MKMTEWFIKYYGEILEDIAADNDESACPITDATSLRDTVADFMSDGYVGLDGFDDDQVDELEMIYEGVDEDDIVEKLLNDIDYQVVYDKYFR